jgi:ABC-2 type transport system ATP-binding protein
MLQRLGIAQAALPDPQLLVLDEPTSGLDPVGQRDIRNLVRALHREGTTVLISSHYLAELEEVCTRVGVLQKGKLVLDAAMTDLIQANRYRVQIDLDGAPDGLAAELGALGIACAVNGTRVSLPNLDDDRYFTVMAALQRRCLRILSLGHPGLLLEHVFLETAGRAER